MLCVATPLSLVLGVMYEKDLKSYGAGLKTLAARKAITLAFSQPSFRKFIPPSRAPCLGELIRWQGLADANAEISRAISEKLPLMVGRLGAREAHVLSELLSPRRSSDSYDVGELLQDTNDSWAFFSGSTVFPLLEGSHETVVFLVQKFMDGMRAIDVLASWAPGEANFSSELTGTKLCRLRDLEPYYSGKPWSAALEGRRVLVVHPFVRTINNQYSRRKMLFADPSVLPEFELITVQPYMEGLSKHQGKLGYQAIFDNLCNEIVTKEFDVAIIGAGWFGFPLAHEVKKLGRVAIHLGGATQLLFGIRGKRWDDQGFKFYNENWVRPLNSERPSNSKSLVLDWGAYW